MLSCKPLIIISLLFSLLCLQAKGQYDFTVDDTEGCVPMKVKFTYTSTATVDSVQTYFWSFGNGETSDLMEPDTITFESEGVFDPTLVLVFNNGTELFIDKPDLVNVHDTALIDFGYQIPTESIYYYEFKIEGALDTTLTYSYLWDIKDLVTRTGSTLEFNFPSVDTFTVSLTVTDEFGCISRVTREIAILEQISIPNVFTPGTDNANGFFTIESIGGIPLSIRIFSRTGILVYEAEGPVITWNGETASGVKMKSGVYYYLLEAISGDPNKIYTKAGFFHMYRIE